MPTKTELYLEKEILKEHALEEYKQGFKNELLPLFFDMEERISNIIRSAMGTPIGVRRRNELVRDIGEAVDSFQKDVEAKTKEDMTELGGIVIAGEEKTLSEITNDDVRVPETPPKDMYTRLVPTDKGSVMSMATMLAGMGTLLKTDAENLLKRMSVYQDEDAQLAAYYDTMVNKAKNNLNVYSLSAVALAVGVTKAAVFKLNRRIISGYQFVAVMDSKTTPLCRSLHSLVWYYNSPQESTLPGEIYPPLHGRCRSGIIPIFIGDVPANIPNYKQWFASQNEATKKAVLGPTRYAMYREGSLSLESFYQNGRQLTLAELRVKYDV